MLHTAVFIAFTFLAALPAQRTWIVDSSSTMYFPDIQSAVNAASDGDVILVRPPFLFHYAWNFVLTKGVTIVGDNGSSRIKVAGQLVVSGLTTNQRVVLRSLEPSPVNSNLAMVDVQNCAGEVVLDDVVLSSEETGTWIPHGDALTVQSSSHVALHRVQLLGAPGLRATASRVTITQSSISGRSQMYSVFNAPPSPALIATGSSIWLANSSTNGGSGYLSSTLPSGNAIGLVLRATNVLAGGANFVGYQFPTMTPCADLDTASWLFHDAATVFQTSITGATGNLPLVESGRINGDLGPAGMPSTFQLDAAPGSFGLLAVALPGLEVPTPLGSLWLEPSTMATLAAGALPLQGSVTLPTWVLRGTALACQGVVLNQGLILLSTPLVCATQ